MLSSVAGGIVVGGTMLGGRRRSQYDCLVLRCSPGPLGCLARALSSRFSTYCRCCPSLALARGFEQGIPGTTPNKHASRQLLLSRQIFYRLLTTSIMAITRIAKAKAAMAEAAKAKVVNLSLAVHLAHNNPSRFFCVARRALWAVWLEHTQLDLAWHFCGSARLRKRV